MKEFLLIFRNAKSEGGQAPSAEQMQAVMGEWKGWIEDIAAQGKFVATNRLFGDGNTVLADGTVTNGPYAEIKEFIGGYLIAKAETLEEATEMAKTCPNVKYGGNVEVRCVMPLDFAGSSFS